MLIKLLKDHEAVKSIICRELRTILTAKDLENEGYPYNMDLYIFIDIKTKKPHFHKNLDEIYFMLDGYIVLKIYDPGSEKVLTQKLSANELCVIDKGLHHGIIEASENNRLCVLCIPEYDESDSFPSEII